MEWEVRGWGSCLEEAKAKLKSEWGLGAGVEYVSDRKDTIMIYSTEAGPVVPGVSR